MEPKYERDLAALASLAHLYRNSRVSFTFSLHQMVAEAWGLKYCPLA